MAPIGILHLMNGFGDASISWIVYRLIQHLSKEEYIWHVAGLSGLGTMQDKFKGLGVQVVDFSQQMESQRWVWQRIRHYLVDHDIHIIHTHTPRTILEATFATFYLPQVAHVATKHLLTTPSDRRWGMAITLLDSLSLYFPDYLVPVSHAMYGRIIAQPGISPHRVIAIPNAIPVDKYFAPEQREACRRELGLLPEALAFGFAGRMEKVKRIDLLLIAFQQVLAEHPQTRLVLVGEGSKIHEWQALAERLGVSQAVIWTGFRQDMPRLLAAMDVYIQSSVNEGLSLSILEAMAAGKAIIATDVGGAQEVLMHQKTGILIPPGSSSAIGAAVVDLFNHPEKRATIAQAARDHVIQEFGVQRMVEGYRHIYETLASQRLPSIPRLIS